jgi:Ser/Thr protein kinase RdoA (MazF antagonist)
MASMKTFDQLTSRGQALRLSALARAALSQYRLKVSELKLVGVFTNTLFRARAENGAAYALRICRPGWRTDTDLRSEARWLEALAREPELAAPRPLTSRRGDYLVTAEAPGVPEPRRCVVMSWVPGAVLEGPRLTPENLRKMGELSARLHQQAAAFVPPPGFTTRQMDTLYARGEAAMLWNETCDEAFTPQTRAIFERTQTRVMTAYRKRYADPEGRRVIHNDLWHGNIKVYHGVLHPFDFEDTVWGYPVQDIAMAFQDLMQAVPAEAFEPLMAAFREGYTRRAPWPETYAGEIDLFRAGRWLWVTNYVATFERPHLKGHLDWLAPQLAKFLETGQLRKG